MNFGNKLKELRMEKNLTQEQIANIFGIARITYNHYETQERVLPLERLNDIANYYTVSIDYILGLNNTKKYKIINKELDKKISGLRIKNFRKERKITQAKLANILNTTQSTIADYERGRYLIATPFLYEICKKYNVSADYLLGRI